MAGDMIGGVGENVEEILRRRGQVYCIGRRVSQRRDHDRHNSINRLLDYVEARRVVPMEDVGSHEGEDGHNVMQHGIRCQTSEVGHQK